MLRDKIIETKKRRELMVAIIPIIITLVYFKLDTSYLILTSVLSILLVIVVAGFDYAFNLASLKIPNVIYRFLKVATLISFFILLVINSDIVLSLSKANLIKSGISMIEFVIVWVISAVITNILYYNISMFVFENIEYEEQILKGTFDSKKFRKAYRKASKSKAPNKTTKKKKK